MGSKNRHAAKPRKAAADSVPAKNAKGEKKEVVQTFDFISTVEAPWLAYCRSAGKKPWGQPIPLWTDALNQNRDLKKAKEAAEAEGKKFRRRQVFCTFFFEEQTIRNYISFQNCIAMVNLCPQLDWFFYLNNVETFTKAAINDATFWSHIHHCAGNMFYCVAQRKRKEPEKLLATLQKSGLPNMFIFSPELHTEDTARVNFLKDRIIRAGMRVAECSPTQIPQELLSAVEVFPDKLRWLMPVSEYLERYGKSS